MKKFFKQKNRHIEGRKTLSVANGFTLVEMLVAISIFSISILALMAVLAQGVADTIYAKEKIIATYLAQEGIEYMRNMRDTFVLYHDDGSQAGWIEFKVKLTGAPAFGEDVSGFYFDDGGLDYGNPVQPITDILLITCNDEPCPRLKYNDATGKYGYASGGDTIFVRSINVTLIGDNEIKVKSTVSWSQGSGNYSVALSESLFNWIEI